MLTLIFSHSDRFLRDLEGICDRDKEPLDVRASITKGRKRKNKSYHPQIETGRVLLFSPDSSSIFHPSYTMQPGALIVPLTLCYSS